MESTKLCMSCMDDDSGAAVCPKCGGAFELLPKNTLQLRPRTLLHEQYLIGRALGHGGFGITYLAWDLGLETKLAVKEYMPNGVAGRASGDTKVLAYSDQTKPEFDWGLDRFLEEARTLKKFSKYPGIVSVDTIFRDNGTAYLVMEHLDGWTFEEFVRKRDGKVSFETALRIMLPVIDALSAVHAEGILHRDISPDNIYLTRAGKVKLIDFGAARNALGQKSRNLSIILKEGYAPEEQYRASGIQGPWTDVYATAATLYHSITGIIPQPALDRMAEDKVQSPSQLGVAIERSAEKALMKALSVRAGDRFQSMEDFRVGLTGADSATTVIPPPPPSAIRLPLPPPASGILIPPPPPPPAPPTVSQRPRWIIPAGLGVVAVIGLAIALMRPTPTPVPPNPDPVPHREDPVPPKPKPVPPQPDPDPVPPQPVPPQPVPPQPIPPEPKPVPPRPIPPQPVPPQPDPIPPQPDPVPPRPIPPPNPNPNPRPGGDYDSLIKQALDADKLKNYSREMQFLQAAIQANPNRWEAYDLIGQVFMYDYNQFNQGAQFFEQSLAHGGNAAFHVMHDHGTGNFVTHCDGWLYVSKNRVEYKSWDSPDAFKATRAEIQEAKTNRIMSRITVQNAGLQLHAFHIRLTSGHNYNLKGIGQATDSQRDMILRILNSN